MLNTLNISSFFAKFIATEYFPGCIFQPSAASDCTDSVCTVTSVMRGTSLPTLLSSLQSNSTLCSACSALLSVFAHFGWVASFGCMLCLMVSYQAVAALDYTPIHSDTVFTNVLQLSGLSRFYTCIFTFMNSVRCSMCL